MDKVFLQTLIEVHAITLIRMKCIISALEEKGILTRGQLDSMQDTLPESDIQEARAKVCHLFGDCLASSFAAKT
jgi:hypothetical protein